MNECPDENQLGVALQAGDVTLQSHFEECTPCRLSALAWAEVLPAVTHAEVTADVQHEGRFELVRPIGRGGFSHVWEARELTTGDIVALKLVDEGVGAEAARRAIREARALTELASPHVLAAREMFRTIDGRIAIVTERLHGEDLAQSIARTGPKDEATTRRLVRAIAEGLAHAHAHGVVHRDLKPANVFLQAPDEHVRILDFGMAKWLDELSVSSKLTRTGSVLGTPSYMSPEQIAGEESVSTPTDVWSLGVVILELMSGKVPIEGRSFGRIYRTITSGEFPRLAEVTPHASPALVSLCDAMLAAEPGARPTAAAIVRALT